MVKISRKWSQKTGHPGAYIPEYLGEMTRSLAGMLGIFTKFVGMSSMGDLSLNFKIGLHQSELNFETVFYTLVKVPW